MLDRTDLEPVFFAPFVSSLMRVEPQWIDYNGHLNMAYYNVLFDRAVDEVYELIGIGALAIPGLGPVVAGGVLATAFGVAGGTAVAGAGIGAATGGVLGALAGLGIPESEARYFETGFRAGQVLVTVEAGARVLEAMAILDRHGADTGPATGPGAIAS